MLQTRVIPCLLLKEGGLVKTTKFQKPVYVGDPINTVKIFNDKEVDELILLDIDATPLKREPDLAHLQQIASQCFMPIAFGGGIRSVEQARKIFALGVEKVIVNTAAIENPQLVSDLSREFGAQAVVVAMDVAHVGLMRRREVVANGGRKNTGLEPVAHARKMAEMGAGEIFLNAVYLDGTMSGFDIELIKSITAAVDVPVIACGGAGSMDDIAAAAHKGGAAAVAAGALFVFQGRRTGVLINYPSQSALQEKLGRAAPAGTRPHP